MRCFLACVTCARNISSKGAAHVQRALLRRQKYTVYKYIHLCLDSVAVFSLHNQLVTFSSKLSRVLTIQEILKIVCARSHAANSG